MKHSGEERRWSAQTWLGVCAVVILLAWGCDEQFRQRDESRETVTTSTLTAAEEIADIVLSLPPWALTNMSVDHYVNAFDIGVEQLDIDEVTLALYERAAHKIAVWSNTQIESGFQLALRRAIEEGQATLFMYASVPYVLTRLIVQAPESVATNAVPFDAFSNLSLRRSLELTTSPTNPRYATRWPVTFNMHGTLAGLSPFPSPQVSGWGFIWRDFAWLSANYSRRVFSVCEDRCGNYSASATCQCDAGCATYGDCCVDLVLCD